MSQRARAGAFLPTLLLLTVIFGTYCATAAAEDDSWDATGMSRGFGGIYVEAGDETIYYDWCGPRNTLRAPNDEGLIPQYNVDQASWVPFADSVTFTVAGEQGSLHTVFARYVDSEGNEVYAAGEMGLYLGAPASASVVVSQPSQLYSLSAESLKCMELEDPEIMDPSRIERISKGSGVSIGDIREMLKQYKQSKKMVRMIKNVCSEKDMQRAMQKMQAKMGKKMRLR